MKASVDTTGKNGHVTKRVSIYSNDRTTPVISLEMTMDVVQK